MTDIIIQGIYGRMGRALVEKIGARKDCRIVAGVDREAGRIGEIPVYAGFDALPCKGVIIDFSSPAGAVAAAQYGAANGLPCVICSTGLSREDEAALEAASTRTPIFRSANMSVGVNVLIELARQATKILGGEFDIEIIEKHHHNKLDAPSGTALRKMTARSPSWTVCWKTAWLSALAVCVRITSTTTSSSACPTTRCAALPAARCCWPSCWLPRAILTDRLRMAALV
jgi:4-hydroxy-tetrahydrodipicolinate reductase